ncbi:MAG: hypothetical protein ACRDZ8_19360 [Acidimicrobiales bacterium]
MAVSDDLYRAAAAVDKTLLVGSATMHAREQCSPRTDRGDVTPAWVGRRRVPETLANTDNTMDCRRVTHQNSCHWLIEADTPT